MIRVRMIRKRWVLRATALPDNPLSEGLAHQFNTQPEKYWTRRGAGEAIHFYSAILEMPVIFWVIDRKDPNGGPVA